MTTRSNEIHPRAIAVNRDVTNSLNSVPILNDTPTKVNLDQSYFRASISAVQCGCWSCGVKLVKTGRWTTSERPDFTCLLLQYKQTRSTTRDDAQKSFWPDWLSWGSDSKSGRHLIRICHIPIRHFCPIHHLSCAFLVTATRMTTRIRVVHLRGNDCESGRDKFIEQRPNLEWLPHNS